MGEGRVFPGRVGCPGAGQAAGGLSSASGRWSTTLIDGRADTLLAAADAMRPAPPSLARGTVLRGHRRPAGTPRPPGRGPTRTGSGRCWLPVAGRCLGPVPGRGRTARTRVPSLRAGPAPPAQSRLGCTDHHRAENSQPGHRRHVHPTHHRTPVHLPAHCTDPHLPHPLQAGPDLLSAASCNSPRAAT